MRAHSLVLLGLGGVACGGSPIYGIGHDGAFVSFDTLTGNMTTLSSAMPNQIYGPQLAATDAKLGRYYSASINKTDGSCNLLVYDLKTSTLAQSVKLPFVAQMSQQDPTGGQVRCNIPGISATPSRPSLLCHILTLLTPLVTCQTLDVDPETGTLYMAGHNQSAPQGGNHIVISTDPTTFDFKLVADLGPMKVGDHDVQRMSAFDSDAKELYLLFVNKGGGIRFIKVALDGTQAHIPAQFGLLKDLAYDASTKRMYGTTSTGSIAHGDLVRSLSYFETRDPAKDLVTVAPLARAQLQLSSIRSLDTTTGVLYALVGTQPNATHYVPSDYCAAHGSPCAAGSLCCSDPSDPRPPSAYGVCYVVDDCKDMTDPVKEPTMSQLLGIKVSSGRPPYQCIPYPTLPPLRHTPRFVHCLTPTPVLPPLPLPDQHWRGGLKCSSLRLCPPYNPAPMPMVHWGGGVVWSSRIAMPAEVAVAAAASATSAAHRRGLQAARTNGCVCERAASASTRVGRSRLPQPARGFGQTFRVEAMRAMKYGTTARSALVAFRM
jgi:hypothetical protein